PEPHQRGAGPDVSHRGRHPSRRDRRGADARSRALHPCARADGRVRRTRASLCVQTETAPYKYVSVEGPASVGPVKDFERDVRGIAHRYLGPEIGEMYLAGTAEDREKYGGVLVTIRPQRWYCVDYGKKAW